MHCSTGFGKKHFPLLSAALQNSLTAALCHCIYTYEDLLIMQAVAHHQCTAALLLAKCTRHCSVLLCKTA